MRTTGENASSFYNAFSMQLLIERLARIPRRFIALTVALAVWALGMAGLRVLLTDLPDFDALQSYTPPLVTRILDRHGETISELYTERRVILPLRDIPIHLQNAVLATEDQDFYRHWGINPKAILRAAIKNLRHGKVVEGGSTITQQLSKVVFLTQAKTFTRKLRELLLALQLERHYSKPEILQMYLNQIYFGHGAYGVESAAKTFFSKPVRDLTLAECALLAGLPRSPRNYSPFVNPESALRRRAWVLSRLLREGYITDQEQAEAQGVALVTQRAPNEPPVGAYFVEYIRQVLEPAYGENGLYRAGLTIHTTLDLGMQRAAEEAMEASLAQFDADRAMQIESEIAALKKAKKPVPPELSTTTAKVQGAIVAMDPRTGGIRALVGGRDFKESQFNRAYQAQRQPGSAFKPFVWAAAVDGTFTEASIVADDRVAFFNDGRDWRLLESATDAYQIAVATAPFPPDQVWVPQNWDFKLFGAVTLRTGLAMSRNLVSIRLAEHLGAPAVVEMAKKCGIESPIQALLSLALGTEQVNLLELTRAYATFANGGIRPDPYAITRIEDKTGAVIEERRPTSSVQLSAQTAYLMVDLLRAVVTQGTGGRAAELGRPVAGKTGTNQDLRDLWWVGFTPDLVAGAWMGNDDFTPLGKKFTASSKIVPWWTAFMKKAHAGIPPKNFPVPDGIVFTKIDKQTGFLALPTCPKVVLAAFKKATDPKEFCPVDHLSQALSEQETDE